jgi:hypothetical protein
MFCVYTLGVLEWSPGRFAADVSSSVPSLSEMVGDKAIDASYPTADGLVSETKTRTLNTDFVREWTSCSLRHYNYCRCIYPKVSESVDLLPNPTPLLV